MKTVTLTIPSWNASIPHDWNLELARKGSEEFNPTAATTITVSIGDKLRGSGEEVEQLFKGMLIQKMVSEEGE